jgi:hypothetical protein
MRAQSELVANKPSAAYCNLLWPRGQLSQAPGQRPTYELTDRSLRSRVASVRATTAGLASGT